MPGCNWVSRNWTFAQRMRKPLFYHARENGRSLAFWEIIFEMSRKKFWFAAIGLPLLAMGFLLQNLEPYRPAQVISGEASCRMLVDVLEPIGGTPQGYAVLFHGVAANKRIM